MFDDSKYYYYQRRWLNDKHGRAFTIATVRQYKERKNSKYFNHDIDAYLNIGDCHEDVSLDFSFDALKDKDLEKQIRKIDGLVITLLTLKKKMMEIQPTVKKEHAEWKVTHKSVKNNDGV